MARNNPKPGGKVDWDATGNIVEPNAGRKTSGWLFSVKPPAQNFNWLWNLLGLQQFYSNAQVEDWIVIDSDADEGDYATFAAYLADSPAAGDRILIKEDQTVTVQTVIPSDITLKFLDGARLLCATNIATSVLQFGSNIPIEGVLNIVLSQTGTTDKAVEYNGDNVVGQIDIENASTGTLTTAHSINSGKTGNQTKGIAKNTGGGTLTNVVTDNSTEDSNNVQIVDDSNNQLVRSRGAYKFKNGLEFDLSSDADGDIYYRDAGILKRLAKGSDGEILGLASGVPAWQSSMPVSSIIMCPLATPFSGFFECDGSSKDTTTYAALFAVIGYDYGGAGASFNIPDFRGEFLRGWDNGAGTDPDAAGRTDRGDGTTGDNVGTKQVDEFKSHTHSEVSPSGAGGVGAAGATANAESVQTGATGGNETRPTNVNIMYCIKY